VWSDDLALRGAHPSAPIRMMLDQKPAAIGGENASYVESIIDGGNV
jgi:hypothetical protein